MLGDSWPRGLGESVTQAPHSAFSSPAPFEMSDESPRVWIREVRKERTCHFPHTPLLENWDSL